MTEPDHHAPDASNPADHATPSPLLAAKGDAGDSLPAMTTRQRRIIFRANHRGTFENDLMIGGFVRAHIAALTEAELDALEAVMELPDTDLADWLTGREPIPPQAQTPMLLRMRDFLNR